MWQISALILAIRQSSCTHTATLKRMHNSVPHYERTLETECR